MRSMTLCSEARNQSNTMLQPDLHDQPDIHIRVLRCTINCEVVHDYASRWVQQSGIQQRLHGGLVSRPGVELGAHFVHTWRLPEDRV